MVSTTHPHHVIRRLPQGTEIMVYKNRRQWVTLFLLMFVTGVLLGIFATTLFFL